MNAFHYEYFSKFSGYFISYELLVQVLHWFSYWIVLSLFLCLWICMESQFPHDIPSSSYVKNCQCRISFDFDYDSFVIKNFNVLRR